MEPKTWPCTGVWLATADPAPEPRGGYFEDREPAQPSEPGRDEAMSRELWARSEAWVGLSEGERFPAPDAAGVGAG